MKTKDLEADEEGPGVVGRLHHTTTHNTYATALNRTLTRKKYIVRKPTCSVLLKCERKFKPSVQCRVVYRFVILNRVEWSGVEWRLGITSVTKVMFRSSGSCDLRVSAIRVAVVSVSMIIANKMFCP